MRFAELQEIEDGKHLLKKLVRDLIKDMPNSCAPVTTETGDEDDGPTVSKRPKNEDSWLSELLDDDELANDTGSMSPSTEASKEVFNFLNEPRLKNQSSLDWYKLNGAGARFSKNICFGQKTVISPGNLGPE
ncbi:hypothetical protein SNE40_002909 [Patella caerulea]